MSRFFRFTFYPHLLCVLICLYGTAGRTNNLSIVNPLITDVNTSAQTAMIQFDISWNNSWRTSTLESNWDAVWLFVKYRVGGTGSWNHATLSSSGHMAPASATISSASDGKGAFIHRSSDGSGSNVWNGVQLSWDYGANGVVDADAVEVCVHGIEMVYIPQGNFYLGDGTNTTLWGQFEAGTSGLPFLVTSEAALTLGGGAGTSLGNNNAANMAPVDDWNDVTSQTLSAAFPKGYNAFYIMKYEITQIQYVDFLNSLSYTQQAACTQNLPNSLAGTPALSNANRNGIDIMTPGINPGTPAVYACNLNGNAIYDETADGHHIACNFLNWGDFSAYLDWAALRPMTELEYEKACRGPLTPVANEYAWGNTTLTCGTAVTNGGQATEAASLATAKCNCNNSLGPMRAGCFATAATTTRTASGGTYYGVLDMCGNLWETNISTGSAPGRAYTGLHGDGNLTAAGAANVPNWPGTTTGLGLGYRGGAFVISTTFLRLSSRLYENYTTTDRYNDTGGRGVRTI